MMQRTETLLDTHHSHEHNGTWLSWQALTCSCIYGKTLTARWGSRLMLILAATLTSALLKYWMIADARHTSFSSCLFYSFIYCACIGVEFFYSFHLFSERIARQPFPLNWFFLFLTVLVSAAIGYLTGGLILVAFGAFSLHEFLESFARSLRFSLVLGMVFGISFFLYESLRIRLEATTLELRTKQLEEERARKLAIAAQLSSLESRVRPHFLFNTLNSISALIREEPVQAERMVERLSAMLRFSLESNQRSIVLLRDEVKIVTDYLEIEKARFGDRLQFQINVPTSVSMVQMPPFALQTLVENSIKHAIANKREGGEILIQAELKNDVVRLEVRDDGPGFSEDQIPPGHGLDNLRSRLYALFGEAASLDIRPDGKYTVVTISFFG
ncbi:MAG: histidine kinase [Acidobacteria bacterium]|nr:histidine kinase [Acidobacteriota bacterium]